jgi:protein-disulfide isomerase
MKTETKKQAARSRRLAHEKLIAAQLRRRRRLQSLAGAALAALAVVAVAIAVSSGGSGSSAVRSGQRADGTVAAVQRLLGGIPQSGARLGSPSAPVTIDYYGDLQCPVCGQFTLTSLAQVITQDVRSGRVQVIYRALETATRNPQTFQTQQTAALAAGQQHRFWNYAELFYRQQGAEGSGYVTDSFLDALARQIPGLDRNAWISARADASLPAELQTDAQEAVAVQAVGTPTVVVKGPRGHAQPSSAVPSYDELAQTIKAVS